MNNLLSLALTILIAFICIYFPIWWIFAIPIAIVFFFLGKSSGSSFLLGFIGVFLTWFFYTFIINLLNGSILSSRIAELFQIEKSIVLIMFTGIIGGLIGGFAAMTGFSFQNKISFKRKTKGRYS